MKKRKLIGVIISETEELYQHRLLKGIISQCYALDYDVAIFSTFIRNTGLPEYKQGEKNIYNLINFDLLDGVIVAALTLAIAKLPSDIEELLLTKCKCPVIYVDWTSDHFPFIITDDKRPMEQMTDHLIDKHGVTDIFCLAADPTQFSRFSTINRVEGFKDSLRKHGLTIDEERISYEGDFWYTGGEELARKIINGTIRKPEAVICISDCMAVGFVNEMAKHGIHVPEDIMVTGYDAFDEAAFCSTVITTYVPPIMQVGAEAVCELTELMTGKRPPVTNVSPGRIELGRSCGCFNVDYMKRSSYHRFRKKNEGYKTLLDSYMMESLTAVEDFDECIKLFNSYLYLIKDYSDFYLCLCENWDGSAHNYSSEKEKTRKVGYTAKMHMVLANENAKPVDSDYYFSSKEMLPDLWKDRPKPKAYYFTPLHFNENTIGYSVLTYGDKVQVFDIIYRNWSRNIMNILEFNRAHRKLYRTSFRDVLTGIYNRRGLDQNLPNLINEAITQHKKLMIIMADLDNLKSINDRFGHKEGDNIINVAANAFQSCSRGDEICARIGGDEFMVIGVGDADCNLQESYISAVQEYIEKYNNKSRKPYRIEISMGAVCDYITDDEDIKIMMDHADHIMYKNKAINKQRRNMVKASYLELYGD